MWYRYTYAILSVKDIFSMVGYSLPNTFSARSAGMGG